MRMTWFCKICLHNDCLHLHVRSRRRRNMEIPPIRQALAQPIGLSRSLESSFRLLFDYPITLMRDRSLHLSCPESAWYSKSLAGDPYRSAVLRMAVIPLRSICQGTSRWRFKSTMSISSGLYEGSQSSFCASPTSPCLCRFLVDGGGSWKWSRKLGTWASLLLEVLLCTSRRYDP